MSHTKSDPGSQSGTLVFAFCPDTKMSTFVRIPQEHEEEHQPGSLHIKQIILLRVRLILSCDKKLNQGIYIGKIMQAHCAVSL